MKSLNKDKAYEKLKVQLFPEKKRNKWGLPVSIAAVLLIAFGIDWFVRTKGVDTTPPPVQTADNSPDKQPGSSKAVLQLADGKIISLGTNISGHIANEGSTAITASNEIITYSGNGGSTNSEAFNTLTVPKGGK